jgi:hypothetical protein
MSKINYNIGLCGEYRLVVKDNSIVVSDTGWCKNTILSGGLEFLSTNSILDGITFLDLGTSSLSGNNYTLSGVLVPCNDSSLTNIPSTDIEYYKLDTSTQVYYSLFSSQLVSSQTESVNEFCVKTVNKTGFSRAVLSEPVQIRLGQNINFEYRVSVDHTSLKESNVEFTTPDNSSFYIPVTSKTFNIPNDEKDINRVGRLVDNYTLALSENNDTLPDFGATYPNDKQPLLCGVGLSTALSRFTPTVVYSGLDDATKQYNVITLYNNISAPNDSGVFDNIYSAVLKYDNLEFNVTRFAFPIVVYNTTLFSNATSINAGNLLSLYYSYTWGENLESPFTTPLTFNLSSPQLIPCNINQEVDLYPNSFITLFSNTYTSSDANGNTTIIRVNLKGSSLFESIKVDYLAPQIDINAYPYGPSPYRLLIYDNQGKTLKDTNYVFTNSSEVWPYPKSQPDSLTYYNNRLYSKINQSIEGTIPNTTLLTNVTAASANSYVDLVINSPLRGTSWKVILDTRSSQILDCNEEQTQLCITFTDMDTEQITLTGSLELGSFVGYTSGFGYPVEIDWNSTGSIWDLTYNGIPLITSESGVATISGASNRCNPVGASFHYEDGVITVDSTVDAFGSCTTPEADQTALCANILTYDGINSTDRFYTLSGSLNAGYFSGEITGTGPLSDGTVVLEWDGTQWIGSNTAGPTDNTVGDTTNRFNPVGINFNQSAGMAPSPWDVYIDGLGTCCGGEQTSVNVDLEYWAGTMQYENLTLTGSLFEGSFTDGTYTLEWVPDGPANGWTITATNGVVVDYWANNTTHCSPISAEIAQNDTGGPPPTIFTVTGWVP